MLILKIGLTFTKNVIYPQIDFLITIHQIVHHPHPPYFGVIFYSLHPRIKCSIWHVI